MRVKPAWHTGRRDCIVYTQLLTIYSSTRVKPAWLTGRRVCRVYTQLLTICSSTRIKPAWLTGTRDCIVYTRGLNGNHTENDRYWQKNNFLLFAKCLKMYSLFRICILRIQKVHYDPKNFFLEKYQYGYQKTQNFMLISNSLVPT